MELRVSAQVPLKLLPRNSGSVGRRTNARRGRSALGMFESVPGSIDDTGTQYVEASPINNP
jgi:hypothetical protein